MFVILTYDVSKKRNTKILKICKKYLIHVQKSVFEGNLSRKSLANLQREIKCVIDPNEDQVAIYEMDSLRYVSKEIIGYHITYDCIL